MKKQFSTAWKGSRQARKQRKYAAQAPQHIKQKMISAHLSKDLREKYKRRSFQLKKGDIVKVMRGSFAGKTGKINIINVTKQRAAIEGVQLTKKDGTKVNAWFNASKLLITELGMDDKRRSDSIAKQEKSAIPKAEKKVENKLKPQVEGAKGVKK